jgi:RHS repeat-associated protein
MLTLDAKSNIQNRYLWGVRQDELLCENDNFVLCDHLGTVREMIDRNGNNILKLKYNAFGKLISGNRNLPRFCYTGKMTDDITNLQWNINRWYDANLGQWISEDTIGFGGRDMNFYRYIYNSSINTIDPLGLWKQIGPANSNIYEAEEDGETLSSLATKISGNSADWVCIWPQTMNKPQQINGWANYPTAKKCARANVSNLTTRAVNDTFRIMPSFTPVFTDTPNNPTPDAPTAFLGAVEHVLNINTYWTNGNNAATLIMDIAHRGRTPISHLILASHHNSDGILRGHPQNPRDFVVADITALATANGIGNNGSNDYSHASQMAGPPRCWMRYGGHIWGVGCNTHTVWENSFAAGFARSAGGKEGFNAVTVHGTTDFIDGYITYKIDNTEKRQVTSAYLRPHGQNNITSTNWNQVRTWNVWHETAGSL